MASDPSPSDPRAVYQREKRLSEERTRRATDALFAEACALFLEATRPDPRGRSIRRNTQTPRVGRGGRS